jgi:hypothetical protein
MGSANGTFLNEEKIAAASSLQSGDLIRVGPFEMRFVLEEVSAAARAPALGPSLAPVPPDEQFSPEPTPRPAVSQLPETEERGSPRGQQGQQPQQPPPPPPADAYGRVSPLDRTEGRVQQARRDGAAVVLTLTSGESLSLPIGDELPLAHTFTVGDTRLTGQAAAVVKRPDGYWVEPSPSCDAVTLNGKPVTAPAQLEAGDTLQVGPIRLEFTLSA